MAIHSKRALVANIFGTCGYISCLLQWLFIALIYLPLLLGNEDIKRFLLPEEATHSAPVLAAGPPSPLLIGFAVIFTVLMLILTVVMLLRAPLSIARTGKKMMTKTAEVIMPVVSHHRPLPAAKKRRLTNQLVKGIKFSIVMLPFLLCLLSVLIETALATDLVIFIGALLAIGSLLWFLAQYIGGWLLNAPLSKLI